MPPPFLTGMRMTDIDLKRIETMTLSLARSGVAPRSINATIQAIRVPLTYFTRMHRLPNPVDSGTVTKGFYAMLKEIGIDNDARVKRYLTLHGLRHLFITLSKANGIPDYLVMKMAGHKSIQMTERYSNHDALIDFNEARLKLEKKLQAEEKKRKGKEEVKNYTVRI